jgi:hypothetical protein
MMTAVQNAVPRAQLGTATAASVMFRQIGGSLAVAVFGAVFTARMATVLGDQAAELGGEIGPQIIATLSPALQETVANAIVSAIHPIFWITAPLALIAFCVALLLAEVPLTNRMVPKGE